MCSHTDSPSPAQRFFDDARSSFERAAAQAGSSEWQLGVAGHVIRMRFAGDALVPLITPALEHLRVRTTREEPAFTVELFDTESTGVRMVPAPWAPDAYGPKGEIVGYNDECSRTVYQPGVDILQLFDAARATAVYWTPSYRYIPWWESSFPLRTAIHWWTTTTPSLQPMHAGAVGRDDGGVLIAGRGGTGKSTTSLACLDGGLLYAGDDYVLVDVDQPTVYSLYNTAKLRPENLHRFPHLERLVTNADSLSEQKAMLFLQHHRPEQLRAGFPVRAILLPRVTGRPRTQTSPATARDALAAIAPTTMFQLPGASPELFEKVGRLTRAVPCFWLDAGTELSEIPVAVDDLIAKLR
ncbi:MAG: serine kinase [Acidimicrobiia bacterium]